MTKFFSKRRLKIAEQIIIVIFFAVIIPMTISAVIINNVNQQSNRAQLRDAATMIADIVSEEVADTITGILSEYAKSKMHECFSDIFAGRFGTSRQVIPVELRGVSTDPYHDSEGRCQYTSTLSGFYPADEPEYTVICVLVSKPTHRSHLEFISPAVAVKGIIKALKHT